MTEHVELREQETAPASGPDADAEDTQSDNKPKLWTELNAVKAALTAAATGDEFLSVVKACNALQSRAQAKGHHAVAVEASIRRADAERGLNKLYPLDTPNHPLGERARRGLRNAHAMSDIEYRAIREAARHCRVLLSHRWLRFAWEAQKRLLELAQAEQAR